MPRGEPSLRGATAMYAAGKRTVQFWASPEIRARLKARADARGVSLAEYARVAVLAAMCADEELCGMGRPPQLPRKARPVGAK